MGIWSAIFKAMNNKNVHRQVKAAGVLKDEEGWYYEESQNFSRAQSTVRIDQQRPGDWEILESSCGIVGLNKPDRRDEVSRFFAGSYRWLRLERGANGFGAGSLIKVIGTYRDKLGKDRAAQLGFLKRELAEDLEGTDVRKLWARIRFIRFPSPGRDTRYLIRFDLMHDKNLKRVS
jgi:hypothetical protein